MNDYKKYDIIIMAIFRWDGPYSSTSISLAKAFSKTNRVFYINHPYTYRDYYNLLKGDDNKKLLEALKRGKPIYKKDDQLSDNFTAVTPPLTLPINFFPKGSIYNAFAKFNNKKVIDSIRQTIVDHDIQQYIFINCFDPFFVPTLPKELKPALNIYQCVDDISQSEYLANHGVYLEKKAIEKADLTLTTSTELFRLKSAYTNNIHLLHNAADIKGFQQALTENYPRPKELENIDTPIIGYIGNLDEVRINYRLLKKTAEAHPDKTMVLIGPINNTQYKTIGLDQLPNVRFLDKKNVAELPSYLKYFDCAIIPFAYNQLTKSIYPLKINEYLAAGKAVVSTAFSEDIKSFSDAIFLTETEEAFVSAVGEAVQSNSEENIQQRTAVAATNTWEARVEEFWNIVDVQMRRYAEV
ncbi:MAG: teichuronic acid biosynthesis glycosyltransferase TuaH [Polaribacter sp.]